MNICTGSQTRLGSLIFSELQHHEVAALSIEDDYYYHPQKLDSLFLKYEPRFFYNFFEYNLIQDAEFWREHAYTINSLALKHISELCHRHNTHLIHLSSLYVFGKSSGTRYSPEDEHFPVNVYGDSKSLGEKYIHESNCISTIIRIPDLYDKTEDLNFPFVKRENDSYITIKDYSISPMTYESCAHYIRKILEFPKPGVEHVSTTDEVKAEVFMKKIMHDRAVNSVLEVTAKEKFISPFSIPDHSSMEPTLETESWQKIYSS